MNRISKYIFGQTAVVMFFVTVVLSFVLAEVAVYVREHESTLVERYRACGLVMPASC